MHRRSRRSRSARRRTSALLLSAVTVTAAPLLAACGSDAHPGAAAVVGGQRITVAQVDERVKEVRDAQRAAVPDNAQYQQIVAQSGSLARNTLHSMVLDRVLQRAAQDAGVDASPKDVQDMRMGLESQLGGAKGLETTWLQQYGVPPERLDENLQLQVEAQKLAAQLGTDTQGPAFWKALSTASQELHIDLNPRYGAWDAAKAARVDVKTPWIREVSAGAQKA